MEVLQATDSAGEIRENQGNTDNQNIFPVNKKTGKHFKLLI